MNLGLHAPGVLMNSVLIALMEASMQRRMWRMVSCALGVLCIANYTHAQDEIAAEIQKTLSPPTIDGFGDESFWGEATAHGNDEFFPLGEELESDEDLQVTWKAAWDEQNLYVLVEVQDDALITDVFSNWQDDSIEFYIDAQNLDVESFQPDVDPGQPAYQLTVLAGHEREEDTTSVFTWGINSYDGDDEITQYPQGADESQIVTAGDDAGGAYTFEAAFPWEALEETTDNILARDGEFGFGMAINDNDFAADRDTQLMWATEAADLWQRSDTFPSVALITDTIGGVDVPGDFDGDGQLTEADIDILTVGVKEGTDDQYDLNMDGAIDGADREFWGERPEGHLDGRLRPRRRIQFG